MAKDKNKAKREKTKRVQKIKEHRGQLKFGQRNVTAATGKKVGVHSDELVGKGKPRPSAKMAEAAINRKTAKRAGDYNRSAGEKYEMGKPDYDGSTSRSRARARKNLEKGR